jgi:hypothetical protein
VAEAAPRLAARDRAVEEVARVDRLDVRLAVASRRAARGEPIALSGVAAAGIDESPDPRDSIDEFGRLPLTRIRTAARAISRAARLS